MATISSPLRGLRDTAPPTPRRRGLGLRDALILAALAPITVLLATRLHEVDSVFTYYMVFMITTLALTFYIAFARYVDPSAAPAVLPAPSVSLLVAVKDERDVIVDCIDSLVGQTYPDIEIYVVDDGSTDGTTEMLVALAEHHPQLRLLRNEQSQGKKRALTRAAQEARGELFVFTDSDCVLELDAVALLVDAFRAHPDFGAFSGHARALNADANVLTRMQDTWYETSFSVNKAAESVFGGVTCVSGPLAGFRREAIYDSLPTWADDRFLGAPFPFATDRQLTGYVLADRRWKVGYVEGRAGADRRARHRRAHGQAAGPLEEVVPAQPLLHRRLLLAPRPRRVVPVLRAHAVRAAGAGDGLPPSGALADRGTVGARAAVPRGDHLQGLDVGDRLSRREPVVLAVGLPAADEPDGLGRVLLDVALLGADAAPWRVVTRMRTRAGAMAMSLAFVVVIVSVYVLVLTRGQIGWLL